MTKTSSTLENTATPTTLTAREIAVGTGLSLSSVYRALRGLERKGIVIIDRTRPATDAVLQESPSE